MGIAFPWADAPSITQYMKESAPPLLERAYSTFAGKVTIQRAELVIPLVETYET